MVWFFLSLNIIPLYGCHTAFPFIHWRMLMIFFNIRPFLNLRVTSKQSSGRNVILRTSSVLTLANSLSTMWSFFYNSILDLFLSSHLSHRPLHFLASILRWCEMNEFLIREPKVENYEIKFRIVKWRCLKWSTYWKNLSFPLL